MDFYFSFNFNKKYQTNFSSPLEVWIKSNKKFGVTLNERVSVVDLTASRYLRFDELMLVYNGAHQMSITEKCERIQKLLQQIAPKFIGSKLKFRACIDEDDQRSFNDHFELLDHIKNGLFPLCKPCDAYKFKVEFRFDSSAARSVVSSLLQMTPIKCCSNVEMGFYNVRSHVQLPFDAINNWFDHNSNGNDDGKKKFLQIKNSKYSIAYKRF